jgi:hypothetical protein
MALPAWMPLIRAAVGVSILVSCLSCGGGKGSGAALTPGDPSGGTQPATANVLTVVADAGPADSSVNTLFTSVTVCVPGSSTNCQTIDHIQVDTASYGLRILASTLNLALPVRAAANGGSLVECTVFADGYAWGPVAVADVQLSGETAASVPIQVIGDPSFSNVPADCSGAAPMEEDTVAAFGANGILGIGVFAQDCGPNCVTTAESSAYYACSSTACQATTVPLADQVTNPVTLFAQDNNGSILELPSVAAQGALTLTGSLIFGIDTQSNNASGTQTVLTLDPDFGYLTVLFNGQTLSQSFIDTGSNGIYFDDADLVQCTESNFSDFYCPSTTQNLTATLQGANGMSAAVNFGIANAQQQATNNPDFTVLPQLGGPVPTSSSFDFGLPFYFGRRVATALESQSTSVGTGPYIAY